MTGALFSAFLYGKYNFAIDGMYFNNDVIANSLRNSAGLAANRDYFYQVANTQPERNLYTTPVNHGDASFGLIRFIQAGIDPVEQFVGSFDVDQITVENGFLKYSPSNNTSFNSFFYHITGLSWDNTSYPMDDIHQTFVIYEPIDYSRLNDPNRLNPGYLPN